MIRLRSTGVSQARRSLERVTDGNDDVVCAWLNLNAYGRRSMQKAAAPCISIGVMAIGCSDSHVILPAHSHEGVDAGHGITACNLAAGPVVLQSARHSPSRLRQAAIDCQSTAEQQDNYTATLHHLLQA